MLPSRLAVTISCFIFMAATISWVNKTTSKINASPKLMNIFLRIGISSVSFRPQHQDDVFGPIGKNHPVRTDLPDRRRADDRADVNNGIIDNGAGLAFVPKYPA